MRLGAAAQRGFDCYLTRPAPESPGAQQVPRWVVALLAALAACGSSEPLPEYVVADSAGIPLVTVGEIQPASGVEWQAHSLHRLAIGEAPGDSQEQFQKILSARRTADGRIVVADGLSREIRTFGPGGEHLATLGGRGAGPTEFQSLQALGLTRGDSIIAVDLVRAKVVVFPLDDGAARVTVLDPPEVPYQFPRLLGVFQDGSLAAIVAAPVPTAPGLSRPPVRVLHYAADGRAINTIVETVGAQRASIQQGPAVITQLVPYGRNALMAVGADRVVMLDTHVPELRYYDATGELLRIVKWQQSARAVTGTDWERYADSATLRFSDPERSARRGALLQLPRPENFPIASQVIVASTGSTWVRVAGSNRWLVFGEDGPVLGTARMPAALTPTEIGPDYVLGIWRDELDVESIRLYDLVRVTGT